MSGHYHMIWGRRRLPVRRLGEELARLGWSDVANPRRAAFATGTMFPRESMERRFARRWKVPLVPGAGRYAVTSDKATTYEAVGGAVPVPAWRRAGAFEEAEAAFGLPFVYKARRGSCGRRVYLVDGPEAWRAAASAVPVERAIVQEYVPEAHSHAVRVIWVGGEAVHCSLFRNEAGGWRSNMLQGGRISTWDGGALRAGVLDVARAAAVRVGCPLQCIDIIRPEAPLFLETQWGSFEASELACGVNIYRAVAAWTVAAARGGARCWAA